MIRHNLFYKLLALAFALGLWFYVNSERNPQAHRAISVPVEIRNVPKGYSADLESIQEASVTIEGPKSAVDEIGREDISAWVNANAMPAGQTVATATERIHCRVLGAVQNDFAVSVRPRDTRVRIEALSWKRLPIEVKFLSAPPLGYSYSDPIVTPASLGISGRATGVARVTRLVLALPKVDASGQLNDQFPVVPVDSKGNVVSGVSLDAEKVRLKLNLIEVSSSKVVVVSPDISGEPRFPSQVSRVNVSPASVTLEGKPRALMQLSTVTTEPIPIDGAGDTISRDVSIVVPAGVRVVGRDSVRVTIYFAQPGN